MGAMRDEPLLTTDTSISSFIPEPGSSYLFATSVEERSAHSAEWESRATGVHFVRLTDQQPASFSAEILGQQRMVLLRSREQLLQFWRDVPSDVVYFDITGLSHHVWAPLLRVGVIVKSRIIGVYVEPGDYRPSLTPTEGEIFDLSERILGIAPLPGFASLVESSDEAVCFVPLLGFEGTRFAYVLEHVQPPGGKIVPIVGVPGFRPEYPFYTYHGNRSPLLETRAWRNVRFARANCPFSVFYLLQDIAAAYPLDTLKIAPIGTKPHALGAVLYAMATYKPVELVYDHPIRKPTRTLGTAKLLLYHLSALPLGMRMDSFYTPSPICNKMIGAVRSTLPLLVADFAAGSGELLKAAKQEWPDATFVATDLDRKTVRALRSLDNDWRVGMCDFLKTSSRQRCRALKGLEGRATLVLLNPPFSCRGGSHFEANVAGHRVRCSRAMAFLLNAIRYLAPKGEMVTIVPAGSLYSQKDERAWALLDMIFRSEVVDSNGHRTFNGCFPRTLIVHLCPKGRSPAMKTHSEKPTVAIAESCTLVLHRGKVPMYTVPDRKPRNAIPLVHSTSLQGSKLVLGEFYASTAEVTAVQGPLVLLPRVGQPKKTKLVFYAGTQKMVLSDCIFGLNCEKSALARLHDSMAKNWTAIEKLYTGTGAKYIAASTVACFVRSLGFRVQPANGYHRSHKLARAVDRRSDVEFTPNELTDIRRESERLRNGAPDYEGQN
jgi:hypothetical protein